MIRGWWFDEMPRSLLGLFAEGDAEEPGGGGGAPAEGAEGGAAPAPSDETTPAGGDPPEARSAPKTDWRDRQIDRQHRKLKELEPVAARAAELEAENARMRALLESNNRREAQPDPAAAQPLQTSPQTPSFAPTRTPAAPEMQPAQIMEVAEFSVKVQNLDRELEKMPEWGASLANIQRIAGGDPNAMAGVMRDVLATDNPAKLLVELGKDPEQFESILHMTPQTRMSKLIRMDIALGTPSPKPKPSNAPEPVEAIRASGGTRSPDSLYDRKFDDPKYDDEWYRQRMQEKRNSTGRPWSVGGKVGAA